MFHLWFVCGMFYFLVCQTGWEKAKEEVRASSKHCDLCATGFINWWFRFGCGLYWLCLIPMSSSNQSFICCTVWYSLKSETKGYFICVYVFGLKKILQQCRSLFALVIDCDFKKYCLLLYQLIVIDFLLLQHLQNVFWEDVIFHHFLNLPKVLQKYACCIT